MRYLTVMLTLCVLLACSDSAVMFKVEADEPIQTGELTLNGISAELQSDADGTQWGEWHGSDASGQIELTLTDGTIVRCPVGYVSHGLDVQHFVVSDRNCEQKL